MNKTYIGRILFSMAIPVLAILNSSSIHDEMFQKKWEESELKQLIDKFRTHENYVFEHIRFYPDK